MCVTDGKHAVVTPTTFDYPYRFNNDEGPGTGGMGCLSFKNGLLPFLNEQDIEKCKNLIQKTLEYINKDSLEFNGVLYGGFFKCEEGIKFIEFNSRFGDPEALNVLNLFETPFDKVFENIVNQNLNEENCKFKKVSTFTVYIVSKEYAISKATEPCKFSLDKDEIRKKGAKIYFANAKQVGENLYTSVSNSRLFGITTVAEELEDAKKLAYNIIKENVDKELDYRTDIGEIYKH